MSNIFRINLLLLEKIIYKEHAQRDKGLLFSKNYNDIPFS